MSLKRETYALTLSYIDSFIDYDTEPKIIKTVSIAALMMALKIDHAEMAVTTNQSPFSIQSCTTANKTLNLST